MYDVIIVGARCAGASLAVFLGKLGYRVLLIDKFGFPGRTLSTHIIGETDVYDRIGIRDRMESAGAPAITRMRVDLSGTLFEADLAVTPRVLGLRRELLDPLLLEAARSQPGVDVLLETTVMSVLFDGNGQAIGIQYKRRGQSTARCYGKAIIGADGRHSVVASKVGAAQSRFAEHEHGVYYLYASGIDPLPLPAMEWYWHEDSIILLNPIDRLQHCAAFMLPQERMDAWRVDLEEHARTYLGQIKTLAPRLNHLKVEGQVRGVRHAHSYIHQPYGNGWALVGDAGAHLHPVSGIGIDNAVCCAEYLSESLHRYLSGDMDWDTAMEQYAAQRDGRINPQFEAVLGTLSNAFDSVDPACLSTLNLLCTFPSKVKKLGRQANDVYSLLM